MPSAWIALLTLIFLEIVLGIDNIVFVSITASHLPPRKQPRARIVGLLLAMGARIGLLFGLSLLLQLSDTIVAIDLPWLQLSLSWQGVVVFAGGLFLLYKSVTEVHHKLYGRQHASNANKARTTSFWGIIAQIVILDAVFSVDSILTAVGMVGFDTYGYEGSMALMIIAIVLAVSVMVLFSGVVSRVVAKYPTIQMLALSFLLLVAVMLLAESAHLSGLVVFDSEVGEIPRGYVYFAIAFSLMVEIFNIRAGRQKRKKQL